MALTGQEIRDRRKALKLTQSELAKRLGVIRLTVQRWESGTLTIKSPEMVDLALETLERKSKRMQTEENMSQPYPVEFADTGSIETHQAFFQAYSGDEPISVLQSPPRIGETWRVVAEWDAGHQVPKRGDRQKINPPSLVAWSPKGDRLFTSCDAFGMTAWDTTGWKYGEVSDDAAYGYPIRFFVTQRGGSIKILQETQSYQHKYYNIYDGEADSICEGINHNLWGWGAQGIRSGLNRQQGLDPWRPGSVGELAFVHKYSGLRFVDVTKLPDKQIDAGSFLKKVSTAFRGGQIAEKVPVHEAPALRCLQFDSLGERDSTIFSFHFHPSGEYVAVTTGDWDDKTQRRIHIVHIKSALIVASIPASTDSLGWSPTGRYLLFKKWTMGTDGKRMENVGVWDSNRFEASYGLSDDWYSRPWVLQTLSSENEYSLSADGQRLLTRSGALVASVMREGCLIREGGKVAQIAEREFANAAWHPVDPHCFVTVGGEGSKEYPDTYDRDQNMPHGRLLRIWRLSN
jgi:transcriptional regulator with XRE-family HTH domain